MGQNQFKRFTYLISSESINFSEIKNQESLEKVGIISFEAYQKDENTFLLIDTIPCVDSDIVNSFLLNYSFPVGTSPLERIYEFEQKEVYNAEEGQLKTNIGAKKRFVWTLLLQEDEELIQEYKKVHSIGQAWPEITANMKTVGVKDMEIYLSGTQAILIMDTIPNFNLDEVGPKWQKLPREEEWQAYVAKFQRTDSESSIQEKWQDMIPL